MKKKTNNTTPAPRRRSGAKAARDDVPNQQSLFGDFRESDKALVPLEIIRTETVLSRMPIHILSKEATSKKGHEISIIEKDERGVVTLKWEVSFNQKFGPPGQLAYKIDTLVINRAIYEAGRPVPEVIRLGSLRELTKRVGLGGNTNKFKMALRQNAGAYITALLQYGATDGKSRYVEADFVRYTPVFAGDKLPGDDGKLADAVYIVLSRQYRNVLNSAPNRPQDFNYMQQLPPMAQRFYEIVSYKIFAALKNGQSDAQLSYAEFCIASNQTRYAEKERVQKQMYKVLKPHKDERYIDDYWYEEATDKNGDPDWVINLTPGRRAIVEFRTFNQKEGKRHTASVRSSDTNDDAPKTTLRQKIMLELSDRGIRPRKAKTMVDRLSDDALPQVADKVEYFDFLMSRQTSRETVDNAPGLLISIVEDSDYQLPKSFVTSRMKSQWEREERERAEELEGDADALSEQSDDDLEDALRGLSSADVEKLRRDAIVACSKIKGYDAKPADERSALIEKAFRDLVRERANRASE